MAAQPPPRRDAPVVPDVAPSERSGAGALASVRAHPLLIASSALLALLAALAWSSTRAPTYEATAQILVTPLPDSSRSLPLPLLRTTSDRTRLVETAASLVDSPAAASGAARRLGAGWTARDVDAHVEVLPEGGSDVLSITGRADDARVAARLANEYTGAALEARARAVRSVVRPLADETRRELAAQRDPSSAVAVDLAERLGDLRALGRAGDPTLSLSRSAEPPSASVGASRMLLGALALVVGLAIGVAAALVVDALRPRRVADAEDAVAATGLPVLARVPVRRRWSLPGRSAGRRAEARAVAPLRLLQHQLELEQPGRRRRVLFVAACDGDGVTTAVAALARTLARAGYDALLVDLDPRAPELATRVGAESPPPLAELLAAGEGWRRGLVPARGMRDVKVLAVGPQGALGIPDGVAADLPTVLAEAATTFDYVLVDAPPLSVSAEALRIASGVDDVVLVVRPGKTPLEDLAAASEMLERAHRRPDGLLVVGGRAAAPSPDPPVARRRREPLPDAAPVGRGVEA